MSPAKGIDTTFLQTLLGYNARRAALVIIDQFVQGMTEFELRPVDFSVMSVIFHNPGVTSRQLCTTLAILPPNLVGLIRALEQRGLIERRPHPRDGRALGLHATLAGQDLMTRAEARASEIEGEVTHRLGAQDKQQLIGLLKRIYL